MRIVFLGTPMFAVPALRALAESFEVVLAVSGPDAVRARGRRLEPSAVKIAAADLGVPVRETRGMTPEMLDALRSADADVLCVAAFGCILPDEVLQMAPLGCVNVHASLLPRWRGAAPVQRCILAGDSRTGVSIMRIGHGVDTGAVCARASTMIADKDAEALTAELAELGADLLVDTLPSIASGAAVWEPQDEAGATIARKISKHELWLDPRRDAQTNVRRIRASSASAPARCLVSARPLRVTAAAPIFPPTGDLPDAGLFAIRGSRVLFGCAAGALEIRSLKPEGKREMSAGAWAAGLHERSGSWERLA